MLNGDEIIERQAKGDINVSPWDVNKVGTNSYDVTLGKTLKFYTDKILNPKKKNATEEIIINPEHGHWLRGGSFVLGSTAEYCENHASDLVPMIDGRSSIGRLSIIIHSTAGFGDLGYCGFWTLEISSVKDVILFPGMPIGQLYWEKCNPTTRRYNGKYQHQLTVLESRIHTEFK